MGFFTLVALILVAAKAFGFLSIGWLWCFAPVALDIGIGLAVMGFSLRFAGKVASGLNDELKFGMNKPRPRL